MINLDKLIESGKSVKYKCYTAIYYKDAMYDMWFHNLEIWKTDYKKDITFMVIHATLEKEPTKEEMLGHIKHYIERNKKKMRHRLCQNTGLGNPNKEILDNKYVLPKSLTKFLDDFIDTFSLPKKYGGCDYSLRNNLLRVGIEPSYAGDYLEIVAFDLDNKLNCWWQKGYAWGAYGTGIRKTWKFYGHYKRKSKFVKFIDKWYDFVKSALEEE